MQMQNHSPGSRRTLWVWTTLVLLLLAVTTAPGGGRAQAAAGTPQQQQPRDVTLLTTIEGLLADLLQKLENLLSIVNPTTPVPNGSTATADSSDVPTVSPVSSESIPPESTVSGSPGETTTLISKSTTPEPSGSSGETTGSTESLSSSESTSPVTTESTDSLSSSESTPTEPGGITESSSSSESTSPKTTGSTDSSSSSESTTTETTGSTESSISSESTSPETTESTESSSSTESSAESRVEPENSRGTLYLGKRSLAQSRKLLDIESDICTPQDANDDNDACKQLIEIIDTIDDITTKLEDGEVTQDMVDQLEKANSDMDTILENKDEIGEIAFEDDVKDKIQSAITAVEEAQEKVKADIDTENNNSQTLVIVMGSVGGFIVVALVATLIFAYYKKRKTSIDNKKKVNTEYVPINSFKEDSGHDNPNFQPEVVTAQRPAQPQKVQTYGTPSHIQPKKSQVQDNVAQNLYETPAYFQADDPDSQNVPQRTSYRGGYATETQGPQQPIYSRSPAADKVPRPNFYGNTSKQPQRPVSGANYDTTDYRSPSRPTSKTSYDYERKTNRSGYESDVRVPRVAPKPQSTRPYSPPPGRSFNEEANDPYSLEARANVKRLSGAGGLRRIDN